MEIARLILEDKDNGQKSLAAVNDRYIKELCSKFDGATTYNGATGYWVNPAGKLYEEPVTVCEVFAKCGRGTLRRYMKNLARRYMVDADQYAVSYEVGGKAYILNKK